MKKAAAILMMIAGATQVAYGILTLLQSGLERER